jgi:queuine tRNA-ribosyltransferase
MSGFAFRINGRDGAVRCGEIETPHGRVRTPAFMPVGTAGTVKAMLPETVKATGADIVLGNTYHLMLRPGAEDVAKLGGPILTDSGGFQVMSLAKLREITETGVTFQSHIDGSTHDLTPERSIEIQCLLGADIQMVFDECTSYPCTKDEAHQSMALSMRWAKSSKAAFGKNSKPGQALFGIVQGGVHADLREESAAALKAIGFDGYAVGGLAVGEGQAQMLEMLEATVPFLPEGKPRYLMGVGTPEDLILSVARGMDMFDCVMPTRSGRHGQVFTWDGKLNLSNAKHADDPRPIDETSDCPAARDYSRAYLHHLIKAREFLAPMLLSWANVHFYQELMARMRAAICDSRFEACADEMLARLREGGDG